MLSGKHSGELHGKSQEEKCGEWCGKSTQVSLLFSRTFKQVVVLVDAFVVSSGKIIGLRVLLQV